MTLILEYNKTVSEHITIWFQTHFLRQSHGKCKHSTMFVFIASKSFWSESEIVFFFSFTFNAEKNLLSMLTINLVSTKASCPNNNTS